jgi:SPP1 gp7 family putative phage head morphogenesis protein
VAQRRLPRAARPDRIAAEYRAALGPAVQVLLDLLAELVRDLEREWPQPEPVRTDNDRDVARTVKRTADKLARAVKAESIVPIATKYGAATSDFQRAQLAKQARAAVSIDVRKLSGLDRKVPEQISKFAETNAQLIVGLGQRMAEDIAEIVEDGVVAGSRWETIAGRLARAGQVIESRAALIARDQVGKLLGDINKQRQVNLGVSRYVWRTVRDNRVREEHEALDGDSFEWGSPPSEGHPGEAVNCRCYADPDFSDLLG